MFKETSSIPLPVSIGAGIMIGIVVSLMTYETFPKTESPSKTHYSVCVENTFPKCVLANKSLPSLEIFCKVYTESQCKELKL